jgi:hypothetical protein
LGYNEKWFKVPFRGNILFAPTKIAHELLHFHYYHWNEKKVLEKCSKTESELLKEALTFLLNEEFQNILVPCDNNYVQHEKLRLQLSKFWKEKKNYDALILYGIELVNKNSQK